MKRFKNDGVDRTNVIIETSRRKTHERSKANFA
jgi:hypothetical protein